jgi:hypothetical protein
MSDIIGDFPTDIRDLDEAVHYLATTASGLSDTDLGQPYRWHAHREGVRFALLGSLHELRTLAVRLAAERRHAGPPLTRAHHALAQFNAAARDLDALLLGLTDDEYDRSPVPGEWSLREVVGHMAATQRWFLTLVSYGLRRVRTPGETMPVELPEGEYERVVGDYASFAEIMTDRGLSDMLAVHAAMRSRCLAELADISDEEIEAPSLWWEGEAYTLEYRLHRFEAHLRQHTVQVEKTLDQLGLPANEARRLNRLLYNALAEVEAATIGAPELGLEERFRMAETITGRAEVAAGAVQAAREMVASVAAGDEQRVSALLDEEPDLAGAFDESGVSVVRLALYHGRRPLADRLAGLVGNLDFFDAAALGRLEDVRQIAGYARGNVLAAYSRDGYTALQLACYFGPEDVARFLIDKGADVRAVSRNNMRLQPIHAAAASRSTGTVAALLAAGADPNAAQADDFRPLHAAAQNGDADMVRLLLDHGADRAPANAAGQTPRDLAIAAGHDDVASLL